MKERNVSSLEHFCKTAGSFFIVALCSFALDTRHISEIRQTAQELERSANDLQNAFISKGPNAVNVIAKSKMMTWNLSKLDLIAHRFEASNRKLDESNRATGTILRQKIQSLILSHDSRDRLASEDLPKHRFIIRAYADEVAQKARKLQTSAARIQIASCF